MSAIKPPDSSPEQSLPTGKTSSLANTLKMQPKPPLERRQSIILESWPDEEPEPPPTTAKALVGETAEFTQKALGAFKALASEDLSAFITAGGLRERIVTCAKLLVAGKGIVTSGQVEKMLDAMTPSQLRAVRRDIDMATIAQSRNVYQEPLGSKVQEKIRGKSNEVISNLEKLPFAQFLDDPNVKPFLAQLIKKTAWYREQFLGTKEPAQQDARFAGQETPHDEVIARLDTLLRSPSTKSVVTKEDGRPKFHLDRLPLEKLPEKELRQVLVRMVENKNTAQVVFSTSVEILGAAEKQELITAGREESVKEEKGVFRRAGRSHTGRAEGAPLKRSAPKKQEQTEGAKQVAQAKAAVKKNKESSISDGDKAINRWVQEERNNMELAANEKELTDNYNKMAEGFTDDRSLVQKFLKLGRSPETRKQEAESAINLIKDLITTEGLQDHAEACRAAKDVMSSNKKELINKIEEWRQNKNLKMSGQIQSYVKELLGPQFAAAFTSDFGELYKRIPNPDKLSPTQLANALIEQFSKAENGFRTLLEANPELARPDCSGEAISEEALTKAANAVKTRSKVDYTPETLLSEMKDKKVTTFGQWADFFALKAKGGAAKTDSTQDGQSLKAAVARLENEERAVEETLKEALERGTDAKELLKTKIEASKEKELQVVQLEERVSQKTGPLHKWAVSVAEKYGELARLLENSSSSLEEIQSKIDELSNQEFSRQGLKDLVGDDEELLAFGELLFGAIKNDWKNANMSAIGRIMKTAADEGKQYSELPVSADVVAAINGLKSIQEKLANADYVKRTVELWRSESVPITDGERAVGYLEELQKNVR